MHLEIMKLGQLALLGALALLPYSSANSYDSGIVDERSELIARMKKTMASQDSQAQDPRDLRDRIISARECALLLDDLGMKDEVVYDSGSVSIGPEKNGSDISVFLTVGTYAIPRTITLPDARKYLSKRDKK